jgi:hypothetical protein
VWCSQACRQRTNRRAGRYVSSYVPVAIKGRSTRNRQCELCKTAFQQIGTGSNARWCPTCRLSRKRYEVQCPCGVASLCHNPGKYCSYACYRLFTPRVAPNEKVRKGRRRIREDVPGLNSYRRSLLLAKWKRQGKSCWVCPVPASTVDHVIPLGRGGTNYEGNLAPACKSHNSSKRDYLVMEWRVHRSRYRKVDPLYRGLLGAA